MNTNCPACGANGMVARVEVVDLYKCTDRKCRAEYRISPKTCRLCGDWVNDDSYEYCPFHAAYYGEIQPCPNPSGIAVSASTPPWRTPRGARNTSSSSSKSTRSSSNSGTNSLG